MKDIKDIRVTDELRRRANAVTAAMAKEAKLKPVVEKIQREVLLQVPMYKDLEVYLDGTRIEDPKDTYLSSDDAAFEKYCSIVNERLISAGLKKPDDDPETCPYLLAKQETTEAEWALLDESTRVLGLEQSGPELNNDLIYLSLEKRQLFINLLIKLCKMKGV